ncbi:hypothetical protein FACS1894187_15960 [Synergistales bacterium]|nr:hypothetical protein FACS1894187_15960 [Synergistales bacterium]
MGHELFNGYYDNTDIFKKIVAAGQDGKYVRGDVHLERQADIFASELLLPEASLRSDLRSGEFSVAELAKRYKVSVQALEIKLKTLSCA